MTEPDGHSFEPLDPGNPDCQCNIGHDTIGGIKTFLFEPCGAFCPNALLVFAEMGKSGKPHSIIDLT